MSRVGRAYLLVVMFVLPWNGARVGPIALSDVLLLPILALWCATLLVTDRPRTVAGNATVFRMAGLLIGAGSLGALASGEVESILPLVEIGFAALAGAAVSDATRARLVPGLFLAFGVGAVVSGIAGLASPNLAEGRILGFAAHPNHLALTLGVALIATSSMLTSRIRRGITISATNLALGVLFAGAGALLLQTGSRAGLLAAAAGLLAGVGIQWFGSGASRRALVKLSASAAGILIVVTGSFSRILVDLVDQVPDPELLRRGSVLNRLASDAAGSSDRLRVELLRESLDRIWDHLLFGRGFGGLEVAHSVPLQLMETFGLFGALAGAALLVPNLARLWRRNWTNAHFVAMVTLLGVFSLVQNLVTDRYLWVLVALTLSFPDTYGTGNALSADAYGAGNVESSQDDDRAETRLV